MTTFSQTQLAVLDTIMDGGEANFWQGYNEVLSIIEGESLTKAEYAARIGQRLSSYRAHRPKTNRAACIRKIRNQK
ncbi:hypothetical protein FHX09_002758 [Rhizobium sp. BK538]|nr:hypothetical protein [Rhizobium sp. BK060]MBB4168912.1 hypothetical protein [Rhizobium sp. BK538]TCM75214.1 hypothetical protein EV291_115132 [Rhizobium sp. BK068]